MRDVLVRMMEWLETSEIEDAHIVLRDAITEVVRLRTQVDMLRDEVADAKRWAMQERSLRWHNLAANDATSTR
jgi:hypothetical protein